MATKKLENMSVAELRARHKQVTGRSTKEGSKPKLVAAIQQHQRMEERVRNTRGAATTRGGQGRGRAGAHAAEAAPPSPGDAPSQDEANHEPGSAAAATGPRKRGRWAVLSTDQLRRLYEEKVGRPTGSDDRGYLIWKIRMAEQGKVPVGPVQRRTSDEPTKPVTLRFPESIMGMLDNAVKGQGYGARVALLELALGHGLKKLGQAELAAAFDSRTKIRSQRRAEAA